MALDELIQKCKQQDVKAQGSLFQQYSGVLFSICLRYSPNYTEAEDNLQDAFITIFEKIGQFKDKGSFEGWMKRITVNTVLQKYRKQKVFNIKEEANIEQPDDDDVVIESEVPLDYLLQIIQELPDRYRLVFSMYVLDGYAHKEIAEMLGISDGTSKSNLARARGILKKKVEAYKKSR
ncbi:RNA polymerase sigma factor [Marinirhabdus gelatinilytica]|uniref:RNA polymerase sigma-70 factor (ECF subfamily) n=1 Tax=Marinirhabdus gelatinilytica TaxID=1703343 RepID=A0A370QJN2_9FLAO|nr:sigma-70 family RNA polymerase sigma factor [Marinirhabdus gelatinilytica]RDK88565.1 RNA polymerase sigma-70 factor (ECF subfamily) [Marinirhabdus gelatinilytica]